MASGKATTDSTAATAPPTKIRRPARVKNIPADQSDSTMTAIPTTMDDREPAMGTTAAAAEVAASAKVRRRGFLVSRPIESSRVGTVRVKATNPLTNVNVDDTRARPVLSTVTGPIA